MASKIIFRTLFIISGLMWLIFSWITLNSEGASTAVAALMIINGLCYFALAALFFKNTFFKILTILFLAINLITTVTDQAGSYDYITFLLGFISLLVAAYCTKNSQKNIQTRYKGE